MRADDLTGSKEGSPPTTYFVYFQVNIGVLYFLDYFVEDIYLLVALFAFLQIFDPNLVLLLLHFRLYPIPPAFT